MTTQSRIGLGTVIRGAVRGDGDIDIEGRVEGTIDVAGDLVFTESARVKIESGALSGQRVTVRGAVAGNIEGSSAIVLESGARVVGDLSAPSIGIRPGGLLRGHVSTGGGGPSGISGAVTKRRGERTEQRAVEPPPRREPARPPPQRPAAKAPLMPEPPPKRPAVRAAPAPVMPALKKGQKGQMKKRGG